MTIPKRFRRLISFFLSFTLLFQAFTPAVLAVDGLIAPEPTVAEEQATPTPEPTATSTETVILAPTEEITPTPGISPSTEPSPTPTEELTSTPEVTPTPTVEVTVSPEATPSPTPILEPTQAITETSPPAESTPTGTPTPSPSEANPPLVETPSPTETLTPTPTPSPEPSPSPSPSPAVSASTNSLASLITDKFDYYPTDTVNITGSNLAPFQTYTIVISSTDSPAVTEQDLVLTGGSGSFTYSYQLDGHYRPNYLVELKNSSGSTVATVTFTDSSSKITTVSVIDLTPNTVIPGQTKVPLMSFTIKSSDGNEDLEGVKAQYIGTDKADIDSLYLYRESGGNGGSFDPATDIQMISDSVPSSGGEFDLNPPTPDFAMDTNVSYQFYLVADINSGAVVNNFVDVKIKKDKINLNSGNWPNTAGELTFDPSDSSTIVAANVAPSFDAIANQTVDENSSSQDVSITNVSPGPSDESGQTITMAATSSDPTIVPNPSVSGSGSTRTLTYTPATNKFGTATITVTADDGQSQNNTYSRIFTITVNQDTTPPVITLLDTSPIDVEIGSLYTDAGATASDNIDGDLTDSINTSNPVDTSTLGTYTVSYDVSDSSGNAAAQVTRTVNVVDTTAPTVTLSSVASDPTRDNPIAVTATFSETVNEFAVDDISVGNGTAENFSGSDTTYTFDVTPTTDGVVTIDVGAGVAQDLAGNDNTAAGQLTRTYDNTPPIVTIDSLVTNDSTPALSGEVDDEEASVNVTVNGNTYTASNNGDGTWTLDDDMVDSLPDGTYNVNVSATDTAENVGNDETTNELIIDTVAPNSTFDSPGTDSFWNTLITISGSSTDIPNTSVNYLKLYYRTHGEEEGEWIEIPESQQNNVEDNDPFSWTYDWTPPTEGHFDVKAEATDKAGNTEASPVRENITYDTTAPTKPTTTPAAGDYASDQSVTLESSDSLSGLDKIYYTTDGSTPDKTKTEYIGAIAVNKDLTIKAIAYDNAGNASDILEATYGIAPVISAETSSSTAETSTTITWTTDDPATSRVIYDTISHPGLGEAPNYGYANSTVEADTGPKVLNHSVTVSGLVSGTTYYYRTVSRGSPEAVSDEHSLTTSSSGSGGNGGSGVSDGRSDGIGGQTPVCNDTKPGSAPTLFSALGGYNSVTLKWTEAVDPLTYYLITYGTKPGAQTYGNPNVGGKGTTGYTVSGLSGGITYYFQVRAGNGCAPGDFSNEISATTLGAAIAGETPAEGFAPGVKGVSTELTPTPSPSTTPASAVLGETKNNQFSWWLIFLLIATGGFGAWIFFRRK